ncbi:MAG: hypothetical protein LBE91_17670 [Tannerella sp.]|jgi:hypothetical protein|nr:hypothetical protein [Tannerella sp.]
MKQKEINFYENQNVLNLKCWYWWLLALFINGLFIFGFVQQIVFHRQFGNNPMSDTGLSIFVPLALIISLFFLCFTRLETVIDNNGISIRYFPSLWRYKTVVWDDIETIYIRKYNPLINNRLSSSIVYKLYGNIGLQLELKNGKRILVGTQRSEEIEEILKQRTPESSNSQIFKSSNLKS